MNWIPYGPHAVLLKFADAVGEKAFERCHSIVTELEDRPPNGLIEFVPGFTTMLLEFDPSLVPDPSLIASELVAKLDALAAAELPPTTVREIPVIYDGPDLERVARLHGLTSREVCDLHSAPIYKVYLLGFSPGFPYLGDLDPRLHTPRLPSPRPKVRAGSVAIGGKHTGIYSVDSPGGWNVIGHTPEKIFDPARKGSEDLDMFLLKPGDRVRFVPEKFNP
jgi:inhibitor of KinA